MVKQDYKRIMVAVDGSKEAESAFRRGVRAALTNDSKLFIAHVIDTRSLQIFPDFDYPMTNQQMMDQTLLLAKESLNTYEDWAKKQEVKKVEKVLKYGSPKVEIATTIPEENKIDLLLVGATGLNAVERIFIGSVSENVVRNAPCDVLVVRSDDTDDQEEMIDSGLK